MEEQAFCMRIEGFQIPKNVKRKWEQGKRDDASARLTTLENLEIKLQAAEERRHTIYEARRSKANRYRVRTINDPSAALERLEKRLAAAESKRLAVLHAVKVRAAVTANRAAAVARAEAARRKQLQSRLEQSLEAAEVARAAHLADTAARAAKTSSKASASARVAKQREQTQAASRLTTLLHRMKRAEASRKQVLVARKESAAAVAASSAVTIPTGLQDLPVGVTNMSISPLNSASSIFLGDTSMPAADTTSPFHNLNLNQSVIGPNAGQWLHRQAAARRIQRCWRSFSSKHGTTNVLVSKFAATKIPFSGQAPSSSAAAQQEDEEEQDTPRNQQDFTPTPSGNNSPRSTLPPPGRILTSTGGNNNNGRTAPANTPADALTPIDSSTPADTPRAGSPLLLYGPPTPPMAVPIPAATTTAAEDAGNSGAEVPSHHLRVGGMPHSFSGTTSGVSSFSPSHRRQPVARLASSLADMAASTSLHEEAPVPLPASFHATALSFDEFAEAMSAPETLKATQAVLRRFEDMGKVKESYARGNVCEGLLKRLFPKLPKGRKADRYPPRAFLSAYMIQSHPEVVLSQQGPRETALADAAGAMLATFEALLSRFLPSTSSSSTSSSSMPLACLLRQFDESWVAYLELFIAWKSHDAAGLESDLIRAAVELETSRLLKIGSRNATLATAALRAEAAKQDIEALEEGVDHDLKLISERVERLTGRQGVARLEAALAAARASAASIAVQQYNATQSMVTEPPESSSTSTSPSPSNSPAKKVQRRQGQYASTSSSPSPASSLPSSPKHASTQDEKVQHPSHQEAQQPQSDSSSGGGGGNLVLMWQLLYDSTWHLPMDEAESSWKDAVGESDPMAEAAPTPQDLEALLHLQNGGGVDSQAAAESTEALTAVLHARVRRIAEKAFWDDLGEKLSSGSSDSSAAVGILAEAGSALRAVLPEGSSAAADVTAQLGSAEKLAELLTATSSCSSSTSSSAGAVASLLPGINCDALFQMLEWCGGLLRRLGAPAREAAASAAQASVRKDLAEVTTPTAAGKIVARALRLIAVLLKLLRLDMANAHLGMLARQLGTTPERAALYARSKMQDFLGTPASAFCFLQASSSSQKTEEEKSKSAIKMALKLPHTRGWLALASGRLPHVEAMLSETASKSSEAPLGAVSSISQELPKRLTTGRATTATHTTSSTTTTTTGLAGQLAAPISPKTWQGLVRCGLAQLVAGEGAVTHLALPETLTPDGGRLQAGQNEFQRLVVLTASLLALQHATRTASATSGSAEFVSTSTSNATTETAKRRLSAILASPDVCLADVAAEVTLLAQAPQQEMSVHAVLRNMLGKSSPALRSITSALCNALTAHLVLGPSSPAAVNASTTALTRCGAGALAAEVAILAGKLAEVAAVTEAVCAPWYEILSSDLLSNTGH